MPCRPDEVPSMARQRDHNNDGIFLRCLIFKNFSSQTHVAAWCARNATMLHHNYIAKSKHWTYCQNKSKALVFIVCDVSAQRLFRATSQWFIAFHRQHHRLCFKKPAVHSSVPDAFFRKLFLCIGVFAFTSHTVLRMNHFHWQLLRGNSCDVRSTAKRCGGRSRRTVQQSPPAPGCDCAPRTYAEVIERWLALIRTSLQKAQATDDTCGDRTYNSRKHIG